MRHANFGGVGKYGGVLVVAGDDAMSKSSTMPSRTETQFAELLMPVLAPGNIQDVLDMGRLGYEMSRFCGLWVGFKIDTSVADQFSTAQVGADHINIVLPQLPFSKTDWRPSQTHTLGSPGNLQIEKEVHEARLIAAQLFARANAINKITHDAPDAKVGIIAAGKLYFELRQALMMLGLDDAQLARGGVRLLKVGMPYPLDVEIVRTFARDLQEIIVVEDKRAFIETQLRDILYAESHRPRIVGKRDEQGNVLLPYHSGLDANILLPIIARRLQTYLPDTALSERVNQYVAEQALPLLPILSAPRQPYFCSGCPHNRSTVVPDDSMAFGGIGCHGLVHSMNRHTIGLGHMGGEGAQWAGAAPFTSTPHMFQNIGDGTLFHSGSLAIRQAIAANTNITYKILFNSAVGMTGGQTVDGSMSAAALTRELEAEGVRRIIVTTDKPDKYAPDVKWSPVVEVWHRDRIDEAQRVLREVSGVTVLLHDQMCAAELRRLRKRGKQPDPATRVFINEAVCEGCGDCGEKSNCLSVQPVMTEFGRKTRIHQSSCNKDYSCVLGDCPAFVTVTPTQERKRGTTQDFEIGELPEPHARRADVKLYMLGIGGTGVVTVNQILGTAALLDGKHVDGMDQTGLSQKGGAVVSHLKIGDTPNDGTNLVQNSEADVMLAFDVLTATQPQHLLRAKPQHTIAVIANEIAPTGGMVRDVSAAAPTPDVFAEILATRTNAPHNVTLDANALAEQFFGDHLAANMIVVGAAYQSGLLPMSARAIEQAIVLNGASADMNTQAFRFGRKLIADPRWLAEAPFNQKQADHTPALTDSASRMVESVGASGELLRLLQARVPQLIAYQNEAYAQRYVEFVRDVREAEQRVTAQTTFSEAVARYLYKLMAYKDEYEVARLSLANEFVSALKDQFGNDATIEYQLHPPILRALGMKNKIKFGKWFDSVYRVLRVMRHLRGTPLDVFGYAAVRRTERALIEEYRAYVSSAIRQLSADNYDAITKLAQLPDMVRGYEEIKLHNVARYREAVKQIKASL
jgi:indolepyruvate ferredoxin oxidoreductase